MLVCSLPRKSLTCNRSDTFTMHTSHVHSTDRLLGTKWKHTLSCICDFETIHNRTRTKIGWKIAVHLLFFIPISRSHDVFFASVPFNLAFSEAKKKANIKQWKLNYIISSICCQFSTAAYFTLKCSLSVSPNSTLNTKIFLYTCMVFLNF